ncbi:alkaline phosphatase D family protein [Amphiplicatus metriothermophilus]|uniref:Alkaline phosphatase/alkaline phosphatase D n=1 Tax=Amphiplicatus metriothermophilus TaxID=1519374 RepID=A0A239PKZ2_9PROT|nr:alkaline phosphatase D family protein [Amphiplicatus metriothermophilus]MBB5517435.1 phosphodiesterase/alkaline phosphatase D-like protein [Amphiplicatus metriothermophilus]SNT68230.1 alkaline phosphatase/alkaline phosphatase D [Amphiplicatus metriothermophilus]
MAFITRRKALQTALLGGAAACSTAPRLTPFTATSARAGGVFAHGVASGDPGPDSVVIWTRATTQDGRAVPVSWEVAADPAFADIRARGEALAAPGADWTVKAVPDGLAPGATYYYRFRAGQTVSPVGRTRTLPAGSIERAVFAAVSCSNYPFGFFNVYDQIARRDDLDAVIHLGDYLYEYGHDGYGGETGARLGRAHDPAHETVTLEDYRRRHAQYKSDPAAQAMHAAHPMIMIWDDHETANNSWRDGAENHDPETEGDWAARKRAALQAYYEWMPVREPGPGQAREALFRAYSFGDLLTLTALETRLMARARQFVYSEIIPTLKTPADVARFREEILWDASREMLGAAQLDYLDRAFRRSTAIGQPWRLVANQIIMANVTAPDLTPHVGEEDIVALEKEWDQARAFVEFSALGLPANLDAWDGYPAARERFYDVARNSGDGGLIVLTGDTHTWWANDLAARDGRRMGVELGTHSVTSPSPYRKSFLGGKGAEYALLTARENKAVRYLSGEDHGYVALELRRDGATARFMAVDTVESPAYNAFEKARFEIRRGRDGAAAFASAKGLSFKEQWLF